MADIKFPLLGTEWPRFKLTYLVISLDFAIILSFILYILITDWNIKREAVINDEDSVQVTDFAVSVKGLPDISEYKTQDQLRAMLIIHFEKVIT
jgi:phosphotransferase system  glucose/maltose/N-acetylglucosamine-specific IIC component